jgi:nicotinamidase-related amidase
MSSCRRVTCTDIILPQLSLYKTVGDESTIQQYMTTRGICSSSSTGTPPSSSSSSSTSAKLSDWSALYLQVDAVHALGNVPYRWDQGYAISRLLHVTMHNITVRVFHGSDSAWLHDGNVSGMDKAATIKHSLGMPTDALLMPDLPNFVSEQKKHGTSVPMILAIQETDHEWEIIVPWQLFDDDNTVTVTVDVTQEVVATFKPMSPYLLTRLLSTTAQDLLLQDDSSATTWTEVLVPRLSDRGVDVAQWLSVYAHVPCDANEKFERLWLHNRHISHSDRSAADTKTRSHCSSALLVVDVQPAFVSQNQKLVEAFPSFVESMTVLLERVRQTPMPIVHIRAVYNDASSPWMAQYRHMHPDRPEDNFNVCNDAQEHFASLLSDSSSNNKEILIEKHTFDGFIGTHLESILRDQLGIKRVYVCGVVTSCCVLYTASSAFLRGFETHVIEDCCADHNIKWHNDMFARYSGMSFNKINLKQCCTMIKDEQ